MWMTRTELAKCEIVAEATEPARWPIRPLRWWEPITIRPHLWSPATWTRPFQVGAASTQVLNAAGQVTEGRAALADYARTFANSVKAPRHVITNLVIDGDGNFATLKAYLQLSIMSGEPAQSTVLAIGGYDDTLSKEDGTWRFVRRTFTMDS